MRNKIWYYINTNELQQVLKNKLITSDLQLRSLVAKAPGPILSTNPLWDNIGNAIAVEDGEIKELNSEQTFLLNGWSRIQVINREGLLTWAKFKNAFWRHGFIDTYREHFYKKHICTCDLFFSFKSIPEEDWFKVETYQEGWVNYYDYLHQIEEAWYFKKMGQ